MQIKISGNAPIKIISALLILLIAVWLCATRESFSPKACVKMPDPADTAASFFDALIDGRYEDCDRMLYNYSSIGVTSSTDTEIGQQLLNMLHESYGYEMIGDSTYASMQLPSGSDVSATDAFYAFQKDVRAAASFNLIDGKDAVCAVMFTYFDISSISEDLHILSTETAHNYAYYESADIANEETATRIVSESLAVLSTDIGRYYRTDIFTIRLHYTDGEWKIVLDEDLYRAIIGNIAY